MKRILLVILTVVLMLLLCACSEKMESHSNSHSEQGDLPLKHAVEADAEINMKFSDFNKGEYEYSVFPTWDKNGKESDYKYAVLNSRKPNDSMMVALVSFKDTGESDEDYGYLFDCQGICLKTVKLNDGGKCVFENLPISQDGRLRDIRIMYMPNGHIDNPNVPMNPRENGLLMYLVKTGKSS